MRVPRKSLTAEGSLTSNRGSNEPQHPGPGSVQTRPPGIDRGSLNEWRRMLQRAGGIRFEWGAPDTRSLVRTGKDYHLAGAQICSNLHQNIKTQNSPTAD
jgi:hypothetical protein